MLPAPGSTTPRLRTVFAVWWPLAASWLLMGLELPAVSAVMARLPHATVSLAAYGGVVFPLALLIDEYPRYAAPDALQKHRGHLHNTPLQVLVERGILGLAAWSAIFFAFFWRAVRILRSLPPEAAWRRAFVTGSVAAITGFLVGGLTEYNFGDSEVVLVAYTVMALPFVVERAAREGIAAGG